MDLASNSDHADAAALLNGFLRLAAHIIKLCFGPLISLRRAYGKSGLQTFAADAKLNPCKPQDQTFTA